MYSRRPGNSCCNTRRPAARPFQCHLLVRRDSRLAMAHSRRARRRAYECRPAAPLLERNILAAQLFLSILRCGDRQMHGRAQCRRPKSRLRRGAIAPSAQQSLGAVRPLRPGGLTKQSANPLRKLVQTLRAGTLRVVVRECASAWDIQMSRARLAATREGGLVQ